jgi:hypothetical protein
MGILLPVLKTVINALVTSVSWHHSCRFHDFPALTLIFLETCDTKRPLEIRYASLAYASFVSFGSV